MRISDKNAIKYYLTEASENNWSVRTLDRNISTLYYQRLLSSQNKEIVKAEMQEKTAEFQNDKFEFIKNPAQSRHSKAVWMKKSSWRGAQ
jgi:predicted nuclease of restriction endonuclease-like (RecB) superfamily